MTAAQLREAAAACLAAAIQRQGLGDNWPGPSVVGRVISLVHPNSGVSASTVPAAATGGEAA